MRTRHLCFGRLAFVRVIVVKDVVELQVCSVQMTLRSLLVGEWTMINFHFKNIKWIIINSQVL